MGGTIPNSIREGITKFVGTALVYYFLGWQMKKDINKLNTMKQKVKKSVLVVVLGICVVLNYVEAGLLNYYQVNLMPVNYIMTFFIVMILMILAIVYNVFDNFKILSKIGRQYSDKIYFYHPFVISVFSMICNNLSAENILLNPITVFIGTMGLGVGITQISRRIKQV